VALRPTAISHNRSIEHSSVWSSPFIKQVQRYHHVRNYSSTVIKQARTRSFTRSSSRSRPISPKDTTVLDGDNFKDDEEDQFDLLRYDDEDEFDVREELGKNEQFVEASIDKEEREADNNIAIDEANSKPQNGSRSKTALINDVAEFSPHVQKVIVTCHRGLESVLCKELQQLGVPHSLNENVELHGTKELVVKSNDTNSTKKQLRKKGRTAGPASPYVVLTPPVSLKTLMKCHLYLGSASRIQLMLFSQGFEARALGELNRKISQFPWHEVITRPPSRERPERRKGKTDADDATEAKVENVFCRIKASASKSRLYHTGAIEERVVSGINQSMATKKKSTPLPFLLHSNKVDGSLEPESEFAEVDNAEHPDKQTTPHVQFSLDVYLSHDQVQLWLDTSLTPLHRRGYRLETGKAPLREDMAYSMLYNIGWNPHFRKASSVMSRQQGQSYRAFLDPFCGSGTLAIEAASMRASLLPGRLRSPPMNGTTWAAPELWKKLVKKHSSKPKYVIQTASKDMGSNFPLIACSDRNEGVVELVRGNAERAGVWDLLTVSHCGFASHPWLQKHAKHPTVIGSDLVHENPQQRLFRKEKGLLIATNAPFGKRLSSASRANKARDKGVPQMLPLFQSFSTSLDHLSEQKYKYTASILTNDVHVMHRAFGGSVSASEVVTNLQFQHGGIFAKSCVVSNQPLTNPKEKENEGKLGE